MKTKFKSMILPPKKMAAFKDTVKTIMQTNALLITLCQHGKFPATLLLKFFVLYYKRNIKHFFRIDIQLYQHS